LQAQACDENPPVGYTRSIKALVDGDELTLTVSSRFGGAVESLTWRGKEFINVWDHGRQISYAWHMNGYGECFNPTEPGSASDYQRLDSSSRLLSVCNGAGNTLTTKSQPAYWLAPDQSGFCSGGVETAVNDSVRSEHQLEKTIEIGYRGLDNVIAFTAVVTLPEDYQFNQLEIPTGYLTYEFKRYSFYNPTTGALTQAESDSDIVSAPWSYAKTGTLPTILSTQDGKYAMGAYTDEPILYYGIYGTDASDPRDCTNKWPMVIREELAPAGTYTCRSFVIVGTLEEVQRSMTELYHMHPVDFDPPTSFIDVANCREIAGWAWDPKTPDQPIDVEFYALSGDGSETLLGRVTASNARADLVTVLGDNGEHGYSLPTSTLIHDHRRIVLVAYAINSEPGLPSRILNGSGKAIECPEFGPPDEPDVVSPLTSPGPHFPTQFPCTAARLPLWFSIGLLLVRKKMN